MKLNTGKVAFPIEFDNGDKQNIYFNPNDPGLAIRMKDFKTKVDARLDNIKDIQLNADGTPVSDDMIEKFRVVCDIVCEELDTAFNGEISSVVFKHCSPFAIVEGGEYFIMLFIEAITEEIKKYITTNNKDMQARVDKHIAKYAKK